MVGLGPGDVLRGKYRVVRVLGQGGMGVVVRAKHLGLDRDVAIKMLRPDVEKNPRLAARFAREARAAALLRGEHAVKILDVDEADGDPFLVMEYLEGKDLAKLIETEGPISAERAASYALQACEGLAEAHAAGIVHRDVKPANLFLATTPRGGEIVKLLDFGISKPASGDDPTLTEGDRILGSPSFMSPEQLKSARDVDARTDVWAMGVVLHHLVTGALPFEGDSATAVAARIASEPAPRADSPLADVIAKCLSKDRDARYATIADLAYALAPFAPKGEGDDAARRVSSVLRLPVAKPASSSTVPIATTDDPRVTASLGDVAAPVKDERVTASLDAPSPITRSSPPPSPSPVRARWPLYAAVVAMAAVALAVMTRKTQPPAPAAEPSSAPPPPPAIWVVPVAATSAPAAPPSASASATPKPLPPVKKKKDDPLKLDIK